MISTSIKALDKVKSKLTFIEYFNYPHESGNWCSYQIKGIDPDVMRLQILNAPELNYDWWRFVYQTEEGWFLPSEHIENNIFLKYVKNSHYQFSGDIANSHYKERVEEKTKHKIFDTPDQWFNFIFEQLQENFEDISYELFDFQKELKKLDLSESTFDDWLNDYRDDFEDGNYQKEELKRIYILQEKVLFDMRSLGVTKKELADDALTKLLLNL